MQNIAEFRIIGRIGKVEVKEKVTYLSVASNYNRKDGDEWKTDAHWNNVTLFDKEEDGIIAVRFKEFESAEKFKDAIHGRHFGGRKLEVSLAEDKPRFRKSARGEEPDSDEEERNLDKITRAQK